MKRLLSLRPACFVCLFYIVSSFITAALFIFSDFYYAKILLAASAAIFLLTVILYIASRCISCYFSVSNVIVCTVGAAALGVMLSSWQFGIRADMIISKYSGENLKVEFTVRNVNSQTPYRSVYDIEIISVDGDRVSLDAVLKTSGDGMLSVGDIAVATGNISENIRHGDTAAAKLSYAADKKFVKFSISAQSNSGTGNITVKGEDTSILSLPDRLRSHFSDILKIRIGKNALGLPLAVLLGDKSSLSASVRRDFSAVGASHLLAVSGTHLSVIIGSLDIILKKLKADRRIRNVTVISAAFFFAALTGFSASALRAASMLTFTRLAPMFGRRSDSATSLCTAVSAILIFDRTAAADIGLLLSFCSTLGIVTVGTKLGIILESFCKRIEGIKENVSFSFVRTVLSGTVSYFGSIAVMSISATVFSLPVVAVLFGFPSASALAANLLLVPLITVIISVTPLALLTGIFAPVGNIAASVSTSVSVLSVSVARFMADIGNSRVYLAVSLSVISVIAVLVCISIFRNQHIDRNFRKKIAISLAVYAMAVCIMVSGVVAQYVGYSDGCHAVFVSDGENDGFVISDSETDILIDISDGSKSAAERTMSAVSDGVPEVIVLTQIKSKHISTIGDILSKKQVQTLFIPSDCPSSDRNTLALLVRAAENAGTEVVFYQGGEQVEFGRTGLIMPLLRYDGESDSGYAAMLGIMCDGEAAIEYISGALQNVNFIDGIPFMPRYAVIGSYRSAHEAPLYYHKAGIETIVFASGNIKYYNTDAGDTETAHVILGKAIDRYMFDLD